MDKINIIQFVTNDYNRQSNNKALGLIEAQVNRAADGYLFPITGVTSSYTVSYNDAFIPVDATAGNVTITLLPAREMEQKRLTIKKTDASANTVTIDASGTETIDGALTRVITTQYVSIEIMSYNGNWLIA